jgi:hypothetical protein
MTKEQLQTATELFNRLESIKTYLAAPEPSLMFGFQMLNIDQRKQVKDLINFFLEQRGIELEKELSQL